MSAPVAAQLSSEARSHPHRRDGSAAHRPRCAPPRPACRRNRDSLSLVKPRPRCMASSMVRPSTKLLAHLAHGNRHRRADRPARPGGVIIGAQGAFDAAALAVLQHAAGQHQRPGRGIDEDRARRAGMRRPVMRRDLVADQFVHRLRVRHAQQRLRPGTSAPRPRASTGRIRTETLRRCGNVRPRRPLAPDRPPWPRSPCGVRRIDWPAHTSAASSTVASSARI